jgi:hypothetical protein
MKHKFLIASRIALLVSLGLLSACNSKWQDMPDDELAEKSTACYVDDLSIAMVQVCKNYEKECQRRREIGINVC